MSFCKIFIVNNTEILVQKKIEVVDSKPKISIEVHGYFEEYIPMGVMPEIVMQMSMCCYSCMDKKFLAIDQKEAQELYGVMKRVSTKEMGTVIKDKFDRN